MSVHEAVLAAVRHRLDAGLDVVLTGDTGSGRSQVLREAARRAHDAGRPALLVRPGPSGRDLPFSALLAQPGFVERTGGRPSSADVHAWLAARLDGPRPVVLIDDVEHADRATLGLVLGAGQAAGARFVVVTEAGGDAFVARELGIATSRVEVAPLGIRGMTELLADHAGAPAEPGLVAELTTWTSGNPRAAVILFEAGVRTGRIQRIQGRWSGTGPLDELDLTDIPAAFVSRLPGPAVQALRRLAWCGAISVRSARELVGAESLGVLAAAGRVIVAALGDDDTVAVSPPVLSRALLGELSAFDRAEVADAVRRALGDDGAWETHEPQSGPVWWLSEASELDPPDRRLPESITLLTERLQSRLAALRREWSAARDITGALPLLQILLVAGGDRTRIDEVFESTRVRPHDAAEDVAAYLVLRYQWGLVTGELTDAAEPDLPAEWQPGEWASTIRLAVEGVIRPLRAGRPLADVMRDQPGELPPELQNTVQLLRAEAAIEEGRAEAAESLAHPVSSAHAPADLIDRLAATRADAILLDGRVSSAIAWSRKHLAQGFDRGDPFTVKIHARGLASALLFAGDEGGAWRALSAALRLGRPGPLSAALDERVLGLAAVLSARRGDTRGAAGFLAELERLDPWVRPRLDIMRPWAQAELRYADVASDPEAGELLWRAGEVQRERGAALPALLCWLLIATPLAGQRLDALVAAWAQVDAPVLLPAVRVHRALAEGGDAARLLRSLRGFRFRGPLERSVLRTAAERWLDTTGEALTGADVERLAGPEAAERWRTFATETPDRPLPLTDREREVLDLAKTGLSNRQIAESLFLSLRTVENHMYRARQKTGISRAELGAATVVHG